MSDTRVVDQNGGRAKALIDRSDHRGHSVGIGNVERHPGTTEGCQPGVDVLGTGVTGRRTHYRMAGMCQCSGNRTTYTTGRTRYQRHAPVS